MDFNQMSIPFFCDVTPGGAYFKRNISENKPTDKNIFYAFSVKSLGWGYNEVKHVKTGNINSDGYNYTLLILHESIHQKYTSTFKVLHKEDDYILISPNELIKDSLGIAPR